MNNVKFCPLYQRRLYIRPWLYEDLRCLGELVSKQVQVESFSVNFPYIQSQSQHYLFWFFLRPDQLVALRDGSSIATHPEIIQDVQSRLSNENKLNDNVVVFSFSGGPETEVEFTAANYTDNTELSKYYWIYTYMYIVRKPF